jgi:leader peptidase (prepilin peptidase)/N-methyltransferase
VVNSLLPGAWYPALSATATKGWRAPATGALAFFSEDELLSVVLGAYAVLVALLCGSFINLAADRVPRGESVLRPRSHCRACDRQLNTVDLLPVLGYLIRGGRCATCRTLIGTSAPFVEAATGALMLAALIWLGLWPGIAVGALAVAWFGLALVSVGVLRRERSAEAR